MGFEYQTIRLSLGRVEGFSEGVVAFPCIVFFGGGQGIVAVGTAKGVAPNGVLAVPAEVVEIEGGDEDTFVLFGLDEAFAVGIEGDGAAVFVGGGVVGHGDAAGVFIGADAELDEP